jgi:hypothetical protein
LVVYVDSSLLLAELLAEERRPPLELWSRSLTSSRLLEYEVWNRLHARGAGDSHRQAAHDLIRRIDLIELSPVVLERAIQSFQIVVRTLHGLHLSSALYMHQRRHTLTFATYDKRLAEAAVAVDLPLFDPA